MKTDNLNAKLRTYALFLSISVLPSALQAQGGSIAEEGGLPVVEEGKVWSLRTGLYDFSYSHTEVFRMEGDTLLNGKTYQKTYRYYDPDFSGGGLYHDFYRQEGDKVFVYRAGEEREYLFLDFGLEAGDTMSANWLEEDIPGYPFNPNRSLGFGQDARKHHFRHRKRPGEPNDRFGFNGKWTFRVNRVSDTVFANDETPRRCLYVDFLEDQCPIMAYRQIWVEGIGTLEYGIWWNRNVIAIGGRQEMLCCELGDMLLYQNPRYNTCFMEPTGNDKNGIVSQCSLFQNAPNPFSETTVIRYELPRNAGNASICVFDMQGRRILERALPQGLESGQMEISGNTLQPGMYTYSLLVSGQVTDTKKMLVTK